jgi:hypothetical protein
MGLSCSSYRFRLRLAGTPAKPTRQRVLSRTKRNAQLAALERNGGAGGTIRPSRSTPSLQSPVGNEGRVGGVVRRFVVQ